MGNKLTNITLKINLEEFRYSLIGDGFIKEEVLKMSNEDLIDELEYRVEVHIAREYQKGKNMGLFD